MRQIYVAPWVQDELAREQEVDRQPWTPAGTSGLPYTERFNKLVTTFCTTCVNPLQASSPGTPLYGGLQYAGPSNRYPFAANYKAIPASSWRGLPGGP